MRRRMLSGRFVMTVGVVTAVAAVAWLLLFASQARPERQREGTAAKPSAAVSMGDSFISGEGGRWQGNSQNPLGDRDGTDRAAYECGGLRCRYDDHRVYGATAESGCHRSDVAPVTSPSIAVDRRINLACSGAQTKHVWRAVRGGEGFKGETPQADQLAAVARGSDVELVVLTAIANDLGFSGHVVDCTLAWSTSTPRRPRHCAEGEQAEIESGLPAARRGLAKAVDEIRAVLAGVGEGREGYRLVIMGYASPIPHGADFRMPEWGWSRLMRGGCPFWDRDADWANDGITPSMDDAMRAVAAAEGAEYLDVQHALDGHQVCDRRASVVGSEGPSERTAEWARRLIPGCCQGGVQESLHPNAYGQRALGRCIGLVLERERGDAWGCRSTPGAGVEGMRLAPLR